MEAEKAIEVSYQFECKKDSLKQVQSGDIKVTFTIHPNDMPPELYTDAMGCRYMAVIVPIGDNEEARMGGAGILVVTPPATSEDSDSSGTYNSLLRLAYSMLKTDEFKDFMLEKIAYVSDAETFYSMEDEKDGLKHLLGIESMTELERPEIQDKFREILKEYDDG